MTTVLKHYINLRELTDTEFQQVTGWTREMALNIMKLHRFSPLPDRPMHPNAKMSSPEPTHPGAEAQFLRRIGL